MSGGLGAPSRAAGVSRVEEPRPSGAEGCCRNQEGAGLGAAAPGDVQDRDGGTSSIEV